MLVRAYIARSLDSPCRPCIRHILRCRTDQKSDPAPVAPFCEAVTTRCVAQGSERMTTDSASQTGSRVVPWTSGDSSSLARRAAGDRQAGSRPDSSQEEDLTSSMYRVRGVAQFDALGCCPLPPLPAATPCCLCRPTAHLCTVWRGPPPTFLHAITLDNAPFCCVMCCFTACRIHLQASKSGKQLEPRFSDPLETEGSNTVIEWERVSMLAGQGGLQLCRQ